MAVRHFTELEVWKLAFELVAVVHETTKRFPPEERYGLTNQLRHAAVSIPSNIAEGQGRGPSNDFVRFLCIARGSLQEVHTQVLPAIRFGYLERTKGDSIVESIGSVGRLINGLIRSLSTKSPD
jgi:four helix bundle protein